MNRPSWDEYFMQVAELAATRSTCLRRQVGAVIVRDKHVISTGYNGAPKGVPHCEEKGGCLREKLGIPSGERHELCRALHAEQNAIIQAASLGQSVEGADIYVTHQPCIICTKMIINAGIKRIFVREGYPDELSVEMLKEAGRVVIEVPKEGNIVKIVNSKKADARQSDSDQPAGSSVEQVDDACAACSSCMSQETLTEMMDAIKKD